MEIDLRHLTRIARRWAWLVALVTVLAALTAFTLSSLQAEKYAATAQILVNPVQSAGTPDFNEIQASQAQAETYRLLATSAPVLDSTIEKLGLPVERKDLSEDVSAVVVPNTQIIEITVNNSSAERAAEIANTIGDEFVAYVGGMKVARLEDQRTQLQDEANALQSRRTELDQQIAELDTPSNENNAEAQTQLTGLREERVRTDETLADLDASIRGINRDIATSTTPVELSNPAEVPDEPYAPRVLFTTALGAVLGFLLGVALVAVLEFMDDTVRVDSNIPELTGGAMLAWIADTGKDRATNDRLYALGDAGSPSTEAVRLLRTNIEFAGMLAPVRTVAVSAPDEDAGASTVTANLGIAMAQAGRETVIIDADLRHPEQHSLFGIANDGGIATLLGQDGTAWADHAHSTSVPGLRVIPSGPAPANPADMLGSRRLAEVLSRIATDVDVVLVDTPPLLGVSDALEVAAHTDGVVIVMQPGKTRQERLQAASASVHNGGMRLLGVVANRVRKAPTLAMGNAVRFDPGEAEDLANPALDAGPTPTVR